VLAVTGVFIWTIKHYARMETDLDEYMPQSHPAFAYSDKAEEWFNIKDGIVVAIQNTDGIYQTATLRKIKQLTQALQQFEQIDDNDVTSLYTADNIVADEQGLDVQPFYKDVPRSSARLDSLRHAVRNNEMVFGRLVSEDDHVALIVARIGDEAFSQAFYRELLSLAERFEGPEQLHIAGRPIVEGTMAVLGPRDMRRMVPIVVGAIALVLLLLLRSFSATVTTLLVVLLSSIWTFGLMAALRIPVYSVSTMIPVMLIAIGVAYGIHLYTSAALTRADQPSQTTDAAVKSVVQSMWRPILLTAVTTMVGFVSLVTSQVYPIK